MCVRFVRRKLTRAASLVAAVILLLFIGGFPADAQEAPEAVPEVDIAWDTEDGDAEHLLRGPMHEAFAAPVPFDPEPGIIVPDEPPAPINEMPSDIRPEAEAVWLEGYWGWDPEREDFLWVSGVYRVPPTGRRWVPGHWQEVDEGYQWNAGFWAPLDEDEITYLPEPPETMERGPTSPAPSDEHFWASGHWHHDGQQYVWRPGNWARGHERWVWVPPHYVWTRRGSIFVAGYWDYRLVDRGLCFAPVYWRRPVYLQAGFRYRPIRVIDLARLHLHMFVRPRYYHYYYGDWYGEPRFGIYPRFVFHGRYGFDPLWAYSTWYGRRQGIDYDARIRGWHSYFGRHEDRRPPRTWRALQQFATDRADYEHLNQVVLGHDLQEFAERHAERVTRVGEQQREQFRETARAMRDFRARRRDGERDEREGRFRLPETPDVARLRERMAERVRPDRPELPERPERPDRPELPDRPERPGVPERPERPERPGVPDRPERPGVPDRPERPERPEVPDRPDRPERPERPEVPDRPERPERPDRPGVPEGPGVPGLP